MVSPVTISYLWLYVQILPSGDHIEQMTIINRTVLVEPVLRDIFNLSISGIKKKLSGDM